MFCSEAIDCLLCLQVEVLPDAPACVELIAGDIWSSLLACRVADSLAGCCMDKTCADSERYGLEDWFAGEFMTAERDDIGDA